MANEQISEITTMPTNATILKIINALIKRYNSLADIYTFKGSVETYSDLLAIQNPNIGDVYNVKQEDAEHGVAAGSNFVWDGTVWDNLGMSLDGLVRKINGFTPDDLGSVIFKYIKSIEDEDGTLNIIVREGESETKLTIDTGKVKTVNGFVPDNLGAVIFQYIKNITNNNGTLTITVRNGEEESTLTIDTGKVKTVNGKEPDETGNISIEVPQPTIATQEEAEAGTDNTKFMTPLRVNQAIKTQVKSIPVGTLIQSGSSVCPDGYLPCNGAAVNRTTYSALYAAIGTSYGSGDGSTTFNLPNASNIKLITGNAKVFGDGTVIMFAGSASNSGGSIKATGIGYYAQGSLHPTRAPQGTAIGTFYSSWQMGDQRTLGLATKALSPKGTGVYTDNSVFQGAAVYIKY